MYTKNTLKQQNSKSMFTKLVNVMLIVGLLAVGLSYLLLVRYAHADWPFEVEPDIGSRDAASR